MKLVFEIAIWWGGFFFWGKRRGFFDQGGVPPPPPPQLQGFPQIVGLGKMVGPSIHGEGNKQDKRRGNIFAKMGNIGAYNSGR